MVVTAALVSLALAAGTAEAQPAPVDQAPPYTLSGVREAAREAAARAAAPAEQAPPSTPPPTGPLARSAKQQPLKVETWSPSPPITLPSDDRLVTPSLAPHGPAWHQQFIAMTEPVYASSQYELLNNNERAVAVASSMGFALAVDGVSRLVQHLRGSYHDRQVRKIRREIDAETEALERVSGPVPASSDRVKRP